MFHLFRLCSQKSHLGHRVLCCFGGGGGAFVFLLCQSTDPALLYAWCTLSWLQFAIELSFVQKATFLGGLQLSGPQVQHLWTYNRGLDTCAMKLRVFLARRSAYS